MRCRAASGRGRIRKGCGFCADSSSLGIPLAEERVQDVEGGSFWVILADIDQCVSLKPHSKLVVLNHSLQSMPAAARRGGVDNQAAYLMTGEARGSAELRHNHRCPPSHCLPC